MKPLREMKRAADFHVEGDEKSLEVMLDMLRTIRVISHMNVLGSF